MPILSHLRPTVSPERRTLNLPEILQPGPELTPAIRPYQPRPSLHLPRRANVLRRVQTSHYSAHKHPTEIQTASELNLPTERLHKIKDRETASPVILLLSHKIQP